MGFKHLVILGAGSTIATIPHGDKNGQKSYTLDHLLTDPFFKELVQKVQNKGFCTDNVEDLCKQLYEKDRILYKEFEDRIRKRYASLELPMDFTILDRLVLSLTPDDAIISFNWDDLIIQAYQRMSIFVPDKFLPILAFPHGNAQAVYSKTHYTSKRVITNSKLWSDSPLNMPVDEVDYKSNLFIKSQWRILDFFIRNAQMITFFGYRGPKSDEQDLQHLDEIFSKNEICDKIEIIDKDLNEAKIVAKNLERFKMQPHWVYTCPDFWHSSIAKHPRRTLTAVGNWNYTDKTAAKEETLAEFMGHVGPIIEQEQNELNSNSPSTTL